ncbi:hypothetical protein FOA52_010028 [Chlamydomonas sp. UWO 241]|nr:hypothetical protein FOA52_010028 [Chlamydomonas sp. UWO 241]
MVYKEANQTAKYHGAPLASGWTTTNQHFHDAPNVKERPNGGPHKSSTHGKLFQGSPFFSSTALSSKSATCNRAGTIKSTADLDRAPAPRQQVSARTTPSVAYHGNGTFVVELPHSTITYPKLRTVGYDQMVWRTEYGAQFKPKMANGGYHVLSRGTTAPSYRTTQF